MSWTLNREHVPSLDFNPTTAGLATSDGLDTWNVISGNWFEPGDNTFDCNVTGRLELTSISAVADMRVELTLASGVGRQEIWGRYVDTTHCYVATWGFGNLQLYVVEPTAG